MTYFIGESYSMGDPVSTQLIDIQLVDSLLDLLLAPSKSRLFKNLRHLLVGVITPCKSRVVGSEDSVFSLGPVFGSLLHYLVLNNKIIILEASASFQLILQSVVDIILIIIHNLLLC